MKKILEIEGMSCAHCEKAVVEALLSLQNVKKAQANAKKGIAKVVLSADVANELISEAIDRIGFKVKGIS
ncbi:MAG: heavy-metal-associated domain-containing protein [Christensenellaceae bacterium]|jgi:copper chaperone CopZ|nr:heavy-metal-associated domain-containing protein [Christensenellaceae bacterium]